MPLCLRAMGGGAGGKPSYWEHNELWLSAAGVGAGGGEVEQETGVGLFGERGTEEMKYRTVSIVGVACLLVGYGLGHWSGSRRADPYTFIHAGTGLIYRANRETGQTWQAHVNGPWTEVKEPPPTTARSDIFNHITNMMTPPNKRGHTASELGIKE